jgi:hypothetical protein
MKKKKKAVAQLVYELDAFGDIRIDYHIHKSHLLGTVLTTDLLMRTNYEASRYVILSVLRFLPLWSIEANDG